MEQNNQHHHDQMLSRNPNINRSRIRDDHGFTLMELLVSMLTATIVVGALFSILTISTGQTTLVADKVQANQLGRTAMTRIVDELHSSCLTAGFAPIQEKSNENELIFKNAYSEEAVLPNAKEAKVAGTGVFEHQIVWNSSAKTLTDFIYKSTSGEGPEAVLPTPDYSSTTHEAANAEPKKGVLLASNVTQTEESGGTKIPIFKYFKYNTASAETSTTPDGTLTEIKSEYIPLKKETEAGLKEEKANSAENVSSVLISFRVAPVDGKAEHDQFIDLSNQVTLTLSAPNTETPIKYSACE
jgi:type II secretory pathway component PulJ